MAYWLDEEWHSWEEIDAVGTAAAGLYARCGSYIADRMTDGFIPTARARMYGTPEWIQRLVEVGLWTVEEGGYRDVRYLELNASKETIDKRKKDHAARQARYHSRQKRLMRQKGVRGASDDASSTHPPSPNPPSGGRAGARGALRPVPDWCGRCNKDTRMHVDDDDRSVRCPRCHPERRAS